MKVSEIGLDTKLNSCKNLVLPGKSDWVKLKFWEILSAGLGPLLSFFFSVTCNYLFLVPVCPHGGGVGLCEYIQHISIFDFICVSASLENRLEK